MTELSVGIVGLDSLGVALTRRLDAQGISNTATDLDSRLLQAHLAEGGSAPAGSPYDLAQMSNVIVLAETHDENLREAVVGSVGLIHALRPGTIIVDMSEVSPQTGPELARALYSKGTIWVEATPIGGPDQVRDGTLTLLTAGSAEALEQIAPVLQAFAAKTMRIGDIGTGSLAKAIASALGMMSTVIHTEAFLIAKRAGLDAAGFFQALPLLAPGMGAAPAAIGTQIINGRLDSDISAVKMRQAIDHALDAARVSAVPSPFLSLLQASCISAQHAANATGDHLDVVRWMSNNAGQALSDGETDHRS